MTIPNSRQGGVELLSEKNIWQRRSDLRGETITATTCEWDPWILGVNVTKAKNGTFLSLTVENGLAHDLIKIFEKSLNFTLKYTTVSESFGNQMDQLANNKAEIAVQSFTISLERREKVDFSLTFESSRWGYMYITKYKHSGYLEAYLRPFHLSAWLGIAGIFIGSFLVLLLLEVTFSLYVMEQESSLLHNSLMSLAVTLFSVISKRFPTEPSEISKRIAFFSVTVAGFLLISIYKSMLVASLAVNLKTDPFEREEDIAGSEYKVVVYADTIYHQHFKNAAPDSAKAKISKDNIIVKSRNNPAKDINQMKSLENGEMLIAYDSLSIKRLEQWPCSFDILTFNHPMDQNALAFQKGWPLKDLFNFHFAHLLQSGVIKKLNNKYFRPKSPECSSPKVANDIHDSVILFAIFGTGIAICAAIFIVEKIWFHMKKSGRPVQSDT